MQWVARYSDGSSLEQYNLDGSENPYAAIDRSRLTAFSLFEGSRKILDLHLDPGQRLIYRRRVEQRLGGPPFTVYLIGWQQTVADRNVQSIAYVFPDGSIELAGRWRDDHPWFYSTQEVSCEKG